MKAGFFETDITPAIGMGRPGSYLPRYIAGVHDPLRVNAAVFMDGKATIALVGVDTAGIRAGTVAQARGLITQRLGIPAEHVLIAASHTHAGGPLWGWDPAIVQDAPKPIRDLVKHYRLLLDVDYETQVIGRIVTAVTEAHRRAKPALISAGSGREDQVVFNRRFHMTNGRTYTHPGKGNPEIVEPAGPVDPEVGVLAAWREDGSLLGCVVNFACHGTTFSSLFASADWIGSMRSTVRAVWGADVTAVFLNGACADVTQVDNLDTSHTRLSGEHWLRRVGMSVGAEVVKVLARADRGPTGPVTGRSKRLHIRRRRPDKTELREARRVLREGLRDESRRGGPWLFAGEKVLLDYIIKIEPMASLEVQALQVGPALYLANPTEYFCRFGLEIKAVSPFPFTWVVGLANGSLGYCPTPDAFEENGGGYETRLTAHSNLAPSAGERIAQASLELASQLTPGPLPVGIGPDGPETPWEYGMQPPEVGAS